MSLGEHLDELRRRLFWALAAPLPLAVVLFAFSGTLVQWLARPVTGALRDAGLPGQLQVLGPAEMILEQFKLSVIGALTLSAPWMLWQFWLFVRPGLFAHERRFATLLVPFSALLTMTATALTFLVMLPLMLAVLVSMGTALESPGGGPRSDPRVRALLEANPEPPIRHTPPTDPQPGSVWFLWEGAQLGLFVAVPGPGEVPGTGPGASPGAGPEAVAGPGTIITRVPPQHEPLVVQQFQLSNYIGFVLLLWLGTVLAFQMPLVIMLLGWVGLAAPEWFRRRRRYAVMACAILAAIITPTGDPLSMIVMLVPLYGLYELGIVLLVFVPAHRVRSGTVFSLRRAAANVPRGGAASAREPMDRAARGWNEPWDQGSES